MLDPAVHAERRDRLFRAVGQPILLMGNGERPRNLPMATVPFRQDSTFLYFTGCTIPGAALLIAEGTSTLFVPEPAEDDALWHGVSHSLDDVAAEYGFEHIQPARTLEQTTDSLANVATIAIPDLAQTIRAEAISGTRLRFGHNNGTETLIQAIISMRRILSDVEIREMQSTALVTKAAHCAAMQHTRPGVHEREIAAAFHHVIARSGLRTAYDSIVTVQGEVLHNFRYTNIAEDGHLLLLDGGAEAATGYATDVTRTWPVSGTFSRQQRHAYEAVLASQMAAIEMIRPGVRYRDVHRKASAVLAEYLVDEGLLCCAVEEAVDTGAHAIFFPHGVGHLIGLDVHDMENFGDRVAYPKDRRRSSQFGTGYLRLDLDLSAGMCVTIEPGFYVVPAILHDPKFRTRFKDQVNFAKAEEWIGFGGIRIEDDVLVTDNGHDVLTSAIPKEVTDIEQLVGTISSPTTL